MPQIRIVWPVVGLVFAIAAPGPSASSSNGRVTLDSGQVSGLVGNDPAVLVYKGIPYAAPPVGDLRWRAPQPVKTWDGVMAADAFGPRCHGRSFGAPAATSVSEDCLNLNVWTPARVGGGKVPVFVWIHGGGFQGGSGSEPTFDGEALTTKGLIVVTFNYRTSVFGFLAHPELTSESPYHASGNYGLLDQIAALQWVQRNIAAFGGDPARVTIGGESAGAYSVSALTASPLARGLFHQAIVESGAYLSPKADAMRSLRAVEQTGADFARTVGAVDLAALRLKSADEIMKAVTRMSDFFAFQPGIDGRVLNEAVYSTYDRGRQARIPLLIGSNTAEGAFLMPDQRPTAQEFEARLEQRFGAHASQVRELYPTDTPAALITSEVAFSGDLEFDYPMWKLATMQRAAGLPVYYYLFGRTVPAAPGQLYKGIPLTEIGALHGAEVAYVFGTLDKVPPVPASADGRRRWQQTDRELSASMLGYWANFVKTGDPNGPGLPAWPRYEAKAHDPLMQFDERPEARPDGRTARMNVLDAVFQPDRRP